MQEESMALIPYIEDQIWLCPYAVTLAGTRFEARMTVIRLASGQLLLHSPCPVTPEIAKEVASFGQVAYIVAPGNFHHLYTASAQKAFPNAKTWICPGVEKRDSALNYDGVLGDDAPPAWSGEIDQVLVRGTRIMREVAMFHRPTRTLILVDLIENFTDTTPNISGLLKFCFKYVFRMWNNPRPAPEYQMGWKDRHAAARSLQRILAWDFERIIVSHGDLIEKDAHRIAIAAWSNVLGR